MENLVKGKYYTATFKDGIVEYLGLYDGIVSIQICTGYPGYSSHPTGKFEPMHYFPERQRLREERSGFRSDASMHFPIGHFTKYEIALSEQKF